MDLPRSLDDMEAYFLLSPGIERQVAIAGDLRKNLRLLELDEAVLDEIVTRGYPSPTLLMSALRAGHWLLCSASSGSVDAVRSLASGPELPSPHDGTA